MNSRIIKSFCYIIDTLYSNSIFVKYYFYMGIKCTNSIDLINIHKILNHLIVNQYYFKISDISIDLDLCFIDLKKYNYFIKYVSFNITDDLSNQNDFIYYIITLFNDKIIQTDDFDIITQLINNH